MNKTRFSLATALVLCCLAPQAQAETWRSVVMGTPSAEATTAFADAFHVGEALRKAGAGDVVMLRDAPLGDMRGAVAALAGAPRVLIYYAGDTSDSAVQGQGAQRMPLSAMLSTLADGGTQQVVVLLENCAHRGGDALGGAAELDMSLEVFLAASVASGQACPAQGDRLSDRVIAGLSNDDARSLQEMLGDVWVGARLSEPVMFERAAPAQDTAAVINPIIDNPIITVSATTTSSDVAVLTPVSVQAESAVFRAVAQAAVEPAGDAQVVVFAAPPEAQLAALPRAEGLPEPAVIVGLLPDVQQASFSRADDINADVQTDEITYENLEARRQLRDEDPDLFEALVAGGAFDPPTSLLETALQTELQRMGCYSAQIDGIWGNGSRRSVTRYFDQIEGETPETREPEIGLFRQIIRQDEVTCPAEARPATTTASSTRNSSSSGTRTSTRNSSSGGSSSGASSTRQQQQAREPAPAATFGTGIGVIR